MTCYTPGRAVAESPTRIPDKAFFKASEVCEIAGVQPYVLRTWELEFPKLGVSRQGTSARIYRRSDLEQVLEIRRLVFDEGLTLAGARRRLGSGQDAAAEEAEPELLPAEEVRARLATIRKGLQAILELLGPQQTAPALPAEPDRLESREVPVDLFGTPDSSVVATADEGDSRSGSRTGRKSGDRHRPRRN